MAFGTLLGLHVLGWAAQRSPGSPYSRRLQPVALYQHAVRALEGHRLKTSALQ